MDRRERFLVWMFGNRDKAHRVREDFLAYVIVVGWGFLWWAADGGLAWWWQLVLIAIISIGPFIALLYLLRDPAEERHRKEIAELREKLGGDDEF